MLMHRGILSHCSGIVDPDKNVFSNVLLPLCVWSVGVECREPTTKKEWLKERNKALPTKVLTKKDAKDPEHVGIVVKDHESAEVAIPLDFGEDWSTFWAKLEKLVRSLHRL
jgi:hypothetical protein